MRRIALISEHASPLSALGGVDSGGQNVYVGQVARHLVRMGYEVDVFTRRDAKSMPRVIAWEGLRVINVDAGPPAYVRKEDMLPYMTDFAEQVMRFMSREGRRYDLVHANFFMSAHVACLIKVKTGIPFVVTFHALGRVRRQFQGKDDFPEERIEIEERAMREAEWVIAECPQDQEDIMRLYGVETSKIRVVPCGFDPDEFAPMNKQFARSVLGLDKDEFIVLQAGRIVPRKGVDTAIEGFGLLVKEHSVAARMIIVGGEAEEDDPRMRDEMARLARIAESTGAA
ncbi:MAG TPA: glycosyltransferase, partial [Dehalococcoidia bacterium]|nr:glycosyltransferase [Dehalococcoidia bacterium]